MSKEEVLKSHSEAVVAADVALYDAAFADGVASVVPSPAPDVQSLIDAAVAAKGVEDQAKLDAMKSDLDAAVAADEADKAALAAKQEILDKVKALLA